MSQLRIRSNAVKNCLAELTQQPKHDENTGKAQRSSTNTFINNISRSDCPEVSEPVHQSCSGWSVLGGGMKWPGLLILAWVEFCFWFRTLGLARGMRGVKTKTNTTKLCLRASIENNIMFVHIQAISWSSLKFKWNSIKNITILI